MEKQDIKLWLPTSAKEVRALGWDQLDVILFTGDAYVDHPSFGVAVIGRILLDHGYKVAIVAQPNWRDDLRDFTKLGIPRLFFGVTGGNMDSMVNHYTANLRLRSDDAYTPGNKAGFRPDYAVTVYTKILKKLYPGTPVVIGGIEASLRRFTHYDYWSNSLKPSILIESGADILAYGMSDKTIVSIAKAMHNGFNLNLLKKIKQIGYTINSDKKDKLPEDAIFLASHEEACRDKKAFAKNFTIIETQSNKLEGATICEPSGDKIVVITQQEAYLESETMDYSFSLPYTRLPHPRYNGKGDIPAYEMIKNSINIHRGCFGGCSFCTISAHQGKYISSRSEKSIIEEVKKIVSMPDFKGYLSDIGGPSANMYQMKGKNDEQCKKCSRPSCIYPKTCANLNNDHAHLIDLYEKIRSIKGIKKAFIGSGIRYDMFVNEPWGERYLTQVIMNHTSGRLKVAPEHTEEHVLKLMRKPSYALFEKLNDMFLKICSKNSLSYQLIPYFISSHPGCRMADMEKLSKITKKQGVHLEQVQDFTPTPMTLSSVMFYTGINPYTGEDIYIEREQNKKREQKKLFFSK